MKAICPFLAALLLFASCKNRADDEPATANPDELYRDYQVWGEEGRDDVTVRLQYRLGGANGPAVLLEPPVRVTFDGSSLSADSAKLTGLFYEVLEPAAGFGGEHRISLTDENGKTEEESFRFVPFSLAVEFPEKLKKQPFTIRLQPVPDSAAVVRLVITDTSFASADVNEEMRIQNGEISVREKHLVHLSPGPVTLEIYREEEKPLKGAGKKGGRLQMTYGLRRQFEFVN